MIRLGVYFDHLLALVSENPGYVLFEIIFVIRSDQSLSPLHGKDYLDIDLSECVGHVAPTVFRLGFPRKLFECNTEWDFWEMDLCVRVCKTDHRSMKIAPPTGAIRSESAFCKYFTP